MSGHTPGPWAVCTQQPEGNPYWLVGLTIGAADPGDARKVCTVHDWGIDWPVGTVQHDMTAANARLIAAAPDLLEACQRQHRAIDTLMAMLIAFDTGFMPSQSSVWPDLLAGNAAIAKATQP